ncbi:hypothetical protein [Noviherbaspirillum aerium]|uniref:hypothetical protein n=1 Tax=Noviherbaspirillum aerium TaxID=2588497 RepID=UPI00124C6983|nr:hypothetical protein [Noviherbaspirillum aerium]
MKQREVRGAQNPPPQVGPVLDPATYPVIRSMRALASNRVLSHVEQAPLITVYPFHDFLRAWSGNEVVLQMEAAPGSRRNRRLGRSDAGKTDRQLHASFKIAHPSTDRATSSGKAGSDGGENRSRQAPGRIVDSAENH